MGVVWRSVLLFASLQWSLHTSYSQESKPGQPGCSVFLGTGENDLPRCNMSTQDYMAGSWHDLSKHCIGRSLEDFGSYAYPYKSDCSPVVHTCSEESDTCRRKVIEINRYAWYPSKCSLHTWDALRLSKQIGQRTVVYAGDSIQVQQFFSLKQMMGPAIDLSSDPTPSWTHFHTIDGGRFHVAGAQFLVGEGIDHVHNYSMSVLKDSHWFLMAMTADILVFNTGHHWHRRDRDFHYYSEMVTNVLTSLRDNFRGDRIIFRTSSWGHHQCNLISHPVNNESELHDYVVNDPYLWMRPIQAEHLWQQTADKLGLGQMFFVNNASVSMARGDAHVDRQISKAGLPFWDCLHNCMPGVPDTWNWLFYNTMLD